MGGFGGWDVVAVTAETAREASAFQAELRQRRELGALPGVTKDTILLAVPDPHPRPEAPWETKSTVVGSGGATLNAVLAVAEQLSARNGTGTLDATVLQSKRVVRERNPPHAGPLFLAPPPPRLACSYPRVSLPIPCRPAVHPPQLLDVPHSRRELRGQGVLAASRRSRRQRP